MTKSFLMSALASALFALSCAGGETSGTATGGTSGSSGGNTGSGGRVINGSGGAAVNSGGSTGSGSGGAAVHSGGSTGSGSGGSASGSGGATGAGTGGATGAGTGGATGAGTGGAVGPAGALTLTAGYASNGTWKGYAYTFVGPMTGSKATITPATFTAATSFCAMGMITADTTYASVAGVGFNVNQEAATTATAPPTGTVATSGTGLAINVTAMGLTLSSGGSQLRAQVKTAGGDYCANIAAAGASVIPWGMFNKTCWDTTAAGAAAFTAGTAITAVELIIPSSGSATVGPFTVCLLDAKSN